MARIAGNPGVSGTVTRINALTFVARGYRDGKLVARCQIFRSSWNDSSAYSNNDQSDGNSWNESMSVTDQVGELGLTAMGTISGLRGRDETPLSQHGAAELYWAMFIEPLQRDR